MSNQKYQPSNGTEGDHFIDKHCMQCVHCDPNPDGKTQCEILALTLCWNVNDKEYPEEWQYNDHGDPTCTKHDLWDWENNGDPYDINNAKAPTLPNPNQTELF